LRKAIAAIAALTALSLASAANAAHVVETFTLDTTEVAQFTGVDFGTVTVTDYGSWLDIDVVLASGLEFRKANDNNHHDLAFKLDKNGVVISNITSNVVPHVFKQDTGNAFHAAPFGQPSAPWNYAIDCKPSVPQSPNCTPGWNPSQNPTTMDVKVGGVNINELKSVPYTPKTGGTKNIYFVVDVVNKYGNTGSIGATWDGYKLSFAPEPGTWALMILGFGCVGASLRRRRAMQADAA
jgi:hypothetical protein